MKRHPGKRLRTFCLMLAFCLIVAVFCIPGTAAATPEVSFPADAVETPVLLNGKTVLAGECMRVDGVTYVPLRNFCGLFGNCDIAWNGKTSTATVQTGSLTLTARTGDYYIYANGHYLYTVGRILNLDGRLYVPVRPMARAFCADLLWDSANARVELTSAANGRNAISAAQYDPDEVYWLSRIISAEAKGEPFLGQMAVGNVVLNRVASRDYPNTIYQVIFDRKYGTQFSPVSFGTIYQTPTESAVIAAKICLEGYTLSDTVLFFMNPRIATSNWISKNRPFAFTIANHDFYN